MAGKNEQVESAFEPITQSFFREKAKLDELYTPEKKGIGAAHVALTAAVVLAGAAGLLWLVR